MLRSLRFHYHVTTTLHRLLTHSYQALEVLLSRSQLICYVDSYSLPDLILYTYIFETVGQEKYLLCVESR